MSGTTDVESIRQILMLIKFLKEIKQSGKLLDIRYTTQYKTCMVVLILKEISYNIGSSDK